MTIGCLAYKLKIPMVLKRASYSPMTIACLFLRVAGLLKKTLWPYHHRIPSLKNPYGPKQETLWP